MFSNQVFSANYGIESIKIGSTDITPGNEGRISVNQSPNPTLTISATDVLLNVPNHSVSPGDTKVEITVSYCADHPTCDYKNEHKFFYTDECENYFKWADDKTV